MCKGRDTEGVLCWQMMLFGQQCLFPFPWLLAWKSASHWDPSCSDLSRTDMGSKGEYKGSCDQAGALGMGVGWDMSKFVRGLCLWPRLWVCMWLSYGTGPHAILLALYEGACSSVATAGQLSAPPFDEQSHSSQLWNDVTRMLYLLMHSPHPSSDCNS